MKIAAFAVASSDIPKTIAFYSLLGFEFPEYTDGDQHIEPISKPGEPRLMIDSKELIKRIIGADPVPGNHSSFAIEYDSPDQVNTTVKALHENRHTVVTEPWSAFWGQRYAIVADPDGYRMDLFATLLQ